MFARLAPTRSRPHRQGRRVGRARPARPHRVRERRVPTPCSSGSRSSPGGTRAAAVNELVTAGAHPAAHAAAERTDPPQERPHLAPADPCPDATGHFGPYGGRFVPEALVAALDELDRAFRRGARPTRPSVAELDRLQRDYTGRPSPAHRRAGSASTPAARGSCSSARTSTTPARTRSTTCSGQALLTQRMGKKRVIAETGAGQHGVATATARPARPRVHRLHGRGGHPAPGAQRRPDEAARRRGRPGDGRLAHPQGRDQRGDARLGHQRRHTHYVLGTVAGPHPFPRWCATSSGSSATRPAPGARAHRPACPTRSRPASAAAPTRSGSSPRSSTTPRSPVRLRGRRRRRRDRPARGDDHRRGARRAARRALLPAAGRERPDHRVALDQRRPRLPGRRARARLAARHGRATYRAGHRRRGHGGVRAAVPHRGHHPGDRVAHALAGADATTGGKA
jgi:hypothetical protein